MARSQRLLCHQEEVEHRSGNDTEPGSAWQAWKGRCAISRPGPVSGWAPFTATFRLEQVSSSPSTDTRLRLAEAAQPCWRPARLRTPTRRTPHRRTTPTASHVGNEFWPGTRSVDRRAKRTRPCRQEPRQSHEASGPPFTAGQGLSLLDSRLKRSSVNASAAAVPGSAS